jgi:HTH-type transcriptional repressor of NAD biosynthesis genes
MDAARVVIAGAESTGKTTLAKDLAKHYRKLGGAFAKTQWVPEYGRDYTIRLIEKQGLLDEQPEAEVRTADWGPEDFAIIAREQQRLEDEAAASGSPLMIADTDALATQLWERRYLGRGSHAAHDAVPVIPPRALWLLADYRDVRFVQDGIRDGQQYRADMTTWFEEELDARGEPWHLISGNREERLATSIRLIDEVLAL